MHLTRSLALALLLSLVLAANAAAAGLTVRYVSGPASAGRNQNISLTVSTTKGASCTIAVRYATTHSKAAGLVRKTVPSNGRVTWTWKIGGSTTKGIHRITVSCKLGSKTGTLSRNLTIR